MVDGFLFFLNLVWIVFVDVKCVEDVFWCVEEVLCAAAAPMLIVSRMG